MAMPATQERSPLKTGISCVFWGRSEDWPDTKIKDKFACFRRTMEATLREEIGDELFNELLDQCQTEFAITKRKHALKNPVVIGELIKRSENRGASCTTLRSIVENIIELRSA